MSDYQDSYWKELVESALEEAGFPIFTTEGELGVYSKLVNDKIQVLLLDVELTVSSGEAILRNLSDYRDSILIILYSAMNKKKLEKLAKDYRVHFLIKGYAGDLAEELEAFWNGWVTKRAI